MKQNGKYLDRVHAQLRNMPRYFTACGRRGVTTTEPSQVTCKRCMKLEAR